MAKPKPRKAKPKRATSHSDFAGAGHDADALAKLVADAEKANARSSKPLPPKLIRHHIQQIRLAQAETDQAKAHAASKRKILANRYKVASMDGMDTVALKKAFIEAGRPQAVVVAEQRNIRLYLIQMDAAVGHQWSLFDSPVVRREGAGRTRRTERRAARQQPAQAGDRGACVVEPGPPERAGEHRQRDARTAELDYPLLLALDLSSHVGWGLLRRHETPRFGTHHLKGDVPTKLGLYAEWLDKMLDEHQPAGIAVERPILMPSDTVALLELLYGLVGISYGARWKRKLLCREIPIHDAKRALTGNGRATKEEMIHAAMGTMRWPVEDDHQADALAVGLCAYDSLWPR